MNVCTPGNCICDAAEYPGDTDCFGAVQGVEPRATRSYTRCLYYFDTERGVMLSVDDPSPAELAAREFYEDPDLTRRAT